jgi:periplasmic divalent cation tolerance protein
MTVTSVYVLFANAEEAAHIGRLTIEKRLAACINILGPVRSIYCWEGSMNETDEVAAIFKTTKAGADALIEAIAELHSYEIPCIVTWPNEQVLSRYADWVADSVG